MIMITTSNIDRRGNIIAVPETQSAITTNPNRLIVPINRIKDLNPSIIFPIILVKM